MAKREIQVKARSKRRKKKKKKKVKMAQDRSTQMQEMRKQGATYSSIAEAFGISRQRVFQLISSARAAEDELPKVDNGNNDPRSLLSGRGIQKKLEQYRQPKTMGDRIVCRRLKKGWTIGQLSQESGLPYGVLWTYENNRAEPSCESLRKLCVALGVSAHWLVFGKGFKRAKA